MRIRLFYGWYIVIAAMILMTYNHGALVYGFSAFITPIAATFGWSYAQITLATSFRGLEVGALEPLIGMAVDRWPARRLMLIGVSLLGLGILCISQASNLAMFYVGFLIIGIGSSLAVFMVPQATIARWFRKDIGKASGIMVMGFGIGGVLLPVLTKMVDTWGWQTSLVILAIGMWAVGIPLSFIFRTRPEEHGLLPDGKPQDDARGPSISGRYDFGTGVKEALKMRAFWHIGVAFMLQMGTQLAVITHVMPYFSSLEIERSTASMIAMLIPLMSLTVRIPFGWLADIFPKKYVAATSLLLTGAGSFLFWLLDNQSFELMILFAVVMGLGIGGMAPLRPSLIREYFGTRRFGTIFGLISIFGTLGTITFPPVAGWVFDTLGFYDPIWFILGCLCMIGVISLSTAPLASRNPKPTIS